MTGRSRRQPVPVNKTRSAPSLGAEDPRLRRQRNAEALAPEAALAGPLELDRVGRLTFRPAARASVPVPSQTTALQALEQDFAVTPPTVEELGDAHNNLVAYLEDQNIEGLRAALVQVIGNLQAAGLME